MEIKKLTKKEFKSTFFGKMNNITNKVEAYVDIWEYIKLLDERKYRIGDYLIENELVESVYRNSNNTFDHVLIPTLDKNVYLIIILNVKKEEIFGHYLLDLNKEYGIKK